MTREERLEKARERHRLYRSTPKGKEKERERHRLYRSTPKGKENRREWNRQHKDRAREYLRLYRSTPEGKDKQREWNRRYKATPEGKEKARECRWKYQGINMANWSWGKYLQMLEAQDFRCLGCCCDLAALKLECSGTKRLAVVDHDHATGEVRGLLCSNCNTALGIIENNLDKVAARKLVAMLTVFKIEKELA